MLTEEEIAARVAPLCDAETTDEERAAFVASVRLGAGLDEALFVADVCGALPPTDERGR